MKKDTAKSKKKEPLDLSLKGKSESARPLDLTTKRSRHTLESHEKNNAKNGETQQKNTSRFKSIEQLGKKRKNTQDETEVGTIF